MSQSRSQLSEASAEAAGPAKDYERIPGRYRSYELAQILVGGDYLVLQEGEQDDGTRTFAVYRRRRRAPESPGAVPVTVVFNHEQIAIAADVVRIGIHDPELLALRLGGAPTDEARMRVRDLLAQAPFLYEAAPEVTDFSDTLKDVEMDAATVAALADGRRTLEALRAALATSPASTTIPAPPTSPAPTDPVNAIASTDLDSDTLTDEVRGS